VIASDRLQHSSASNGRVIAIEGLWFTGKTTLGRALAVALNARFLDEPARDESSSPPYEPDWYARQHLQRQWQARRDADRGRDVILDRYVVSAIAFAEAIGEDDVTATIAMLARDAPPPDWVVFLDGDPRVLERLVYVDKYDKYASAWFFRRDRGFISKYAQALTQLLDEKCTANVLRLTSPVTSTAVPAATLTRIVLDSLAKSGK
jgi:thymidylate kinase